MARKKRSSSFSSDSTCSCDRCQARETVTYTRQRYRERDFAPVNSGPPIQTRMKADPRMNFAERREPDFIATEGCSSSESRPYDLSQYPQNLYRNFTPMTYGRGVSTSIRPYGKNGYI
nr:expressed protein [Hymenolepis microstoma]